MCVCVCMCVCVGITSSQNNKAQEINDVNVCEACQGLRVKKTWNFFFHCGVQIDGYFCDQLLACENEPILAFCHWIEPCTLPCIG